MKLELARKFQDHVAEIAIGPSTLRNQGAKGVVKSAREALKKVGLRRFSVSSEASFQRQLDAETDRVRLALPKDARHWGAARKALNIFLRDVLYHHHLRKHYRLDRIEPRLEVPLDSQTASKLRVDAPDAGLPRWRGVKHLKPAASAAYQQAAREIAREKKLPARVHLDLFYWRQRPPA